MHNLNIRFSRPYSKLVFPSPEYRFCKIAKLLDVLLVELSDLSAEFLAYDTDEGMYPLPKKGKYLMLIFQNKTVYFLKPNEIFRPEQHIFTTIRRETPEKLQYYRKNIGELFNVIIE
jgi:hypothetical protein